MIESIKNTKVYILLRSIYRHFVYTPPKDKKQEDYEYLISHGVETQYGYVTLIGKPLIQKAPNSRIIIGKGTVLVSENVVDNYVTNPAGINHPVILSTAAEGAEIVLHERVGLSGNSIVACKKIEIGVHTNLGVNACVYDTDFHCVEPQKRECQRSIEDANSQPVNIGSNVWIGANSIVLKGVSIEDDAVVGAMSLVTRDVGKGTVVGGVPATVIKRF